MRPSDILFTAVSATATTLSGIVMVAEPSTWDLLVQSHNAHVAPWMHSHPLIAALLLMQVLDIASGLFASVVLKRIDSEVSWRGMSKKGIMWIVVGMVSAIEPFLGISIGSIPISLSTIVTLFYIGTEGISIVENAGKCRVPIPAKVMEILVKFNDSQPSATVSGTVKVDVTTHNEPPKQP